MEYDIGKFIVDDAVYAYGITLKTRHGEYKLPANTILLAIPYLDKIIDYIKETKKHNSLFNISLERSIDKNTKSKRIQQIVFYSCNFCTRLMLDIDKRAIIETDLYILLDIDFTGNFDYRINIYDDSGRTIEEMPSYKIECFKKTISEKILGEDIDLLCHNNNISVYDFLGSFFFVYWLAETYLLYDTKRKVLI